MCCTGHVVMITDGSLDVRCKNNIDLPLLYTSTNAFFSGGTGYNLTLVGLDPYKGHVVSKMCQSCFCLVLRQSYIQIGLPRTQIQMQYLWL